jgi:hypothetical protein
LTARLFYIVAGVALAGLGTMAWILLRIHTAHLEIQAGQSVVRLSDAQRRGTRSSVQKNRKEDVYETITAVGAQPGIQHTRIYNKEAHVRFADDRDDRRRVLSPSSRQSRSVVYGVNDTEATFT